MTDWEAAYVARETPWDKGKPSPALVAALAAEPLAGRVLVPGCGLGNDLPAVLAGGADEVVGVDFAPTAVARATARFAGEPRIAIESADVFALPPEWNGAFDAVVEHTCFCAIPRERRVEYARSIAGAVRPGGELLAIFYLTPRDDPDPALGPPFSSDRDELRATFAPWFHVVSSGPPSAAFPEREGREEVWRLRRGD